MLVLIAVCLALAVSVLLRVMGDTFQHTCGSGWPIVQFAVLFIMHGAAGAASWYAGYQRWSDRLLWMMAVHVHCATYAFNWPVYQGLTAVTDVTRDVLPLFGALGLIVCPSILMYGGPVAAMINPPMRRAEETA